MTGETERMAKVRAAIAELRDKNGRVTPRMVVDAARNKKHPLHDEFEWDDITAADEYRLDQARALIRYVTIVTVDKAVKSTVVAYVRDPARQSKDQGYVALTSAAIERKHATEIMISELNRCESAIERARGIVDVLNDRHPGLSDQLEEALAKLVSIRETLEEAA